MGGILISSCEGDRPLARDLRSRLVELAVPQLSGFVSLTSAISDKPLRTEMIAASAVVVLLSDHAKRDSRVMTETGLAVSLGKPVIAVILDETKPEDLDFIEAQVWILAGGSKEPEYLSHEIYEATADLLTPEANGP